MELTFSAILNEIIGYLVGGITGIASGIGQGLTSLVTNIFVDSTGTAPTLTAFGAMIAIFGGVGLAIGLSKLVVRWLTSFGSSRV